MTWLIALLILGVLGCLLFYGGAARKTIDECEHGVEPEYCNECNGGNTNG